MSDHSPIKIRTEAILNLTFTAVAVLLTAALVLESVMVERPSLLIVCQSLDGSGPSFPNRRLASRLVTSRRGGFRVMPRAGSVKRPSMIASAAGLVWADAAQGTWVNSPVRRLRLGNNAPSRYPDGRWLADAYPLPPPQPC